MLLARISLWLTAIAFAGFGIVLFARPELLSVVGIELATAGARAEIRAFYGGLEIGLAVFFGIAATRPSWYVPALLAQALSLGGLALARLLGIVIERPQESAIYLALIPEAIGCALALVALRVLRRTGDAARE